jgi:hypothetical protein
MNQDGSQLILADTQKKLVFYNVKDDQFDSFLLDSIPISVVASRDFKSLLVNLASDEILLIDIDDRAIIRSSRGQHAGTARGDSTRGHLLSRVCFSGRTNPAL